MTCRFCKLGHGRGSMRIVGSHTFGYKYFCTHMTYISYKRTTKDSHQVFFLAIYCHFCPSKFP